MAQSDQPLKNEYSNPFPPSRSRGLEDEMVNGSGPGVVWIVHWHNWHALYQDLRTQEDQWQPFRRHDSETFSILL